MELSEMMMGYADPQTHQYHAQWRAGLDVTQKILDYMRPRYGCGEDVPRMFTVLVEGGLYDEAADFVSDRVAFGLGCSHSTEYVLRCARDIIAKLAAEDQAKKDRAITE